MTPKSITPEQVRLVNLSAQDLLVSPSAPANKPDVLTTIRRMGVLQIDTISVVARSPYFVLFSRLGEYNPSWLDELLEEKALFEYWAHAACFIPIEEYPLYRRFMLEGTHSYFSQAWVEQNREILNQVLDTVREKGAQRSADFAGEKQTGGWWNHKPEKWALEYWYIMGMLSIAKRDKFQRVYDLTERYMPHMHNSQLLEMDEMYRILILKTVRALGVALPGWVPDYYRLKKKRVLPMLQRMLDNRELAQVEIDGWQEPGLYLPEQQTLIDSARKGNLKASHTTLLSPFDPLTWDRDRVRQLFNFDFMIQSYTPATKRTYGYFPLPILHRGNLIGRLDAKAHRKEDRFEIRGFYLEPWVKPVPELMAEVIAAVKRCAAWHATPAVTLGPDLLPEAKGLLADSLETV